MRLDGIHHISAMTGDARGNLDFWQGRLGDEGVTADRVAPDALRFADPEGLGHELVVADRDRPLRAEHSEVPAEHALSGLVGVRVHSPRPERSGELLRTLLGAERAGDDVWELRGPTRGATIAWDAPPEERRLQGAGTVHHVAWGTTRDEHPAWRERQVAAGVPITPVIDRYYFHSVHFREPSGVLYEIADDGPGFTRDMPVGELGSRVILPAWPEERRAEVEARLTPLPDPRATRVRS